MPSIREHIDQLHEARPVFTSKVLDDMLQRVEGAQVVDTWFAQDGSVALVRMPDGQAYEVEVRPASLAQFQPFQQFYGTGRSPKLHRQAPSPVRPKLP